MGGAVGFENEALAWDYLLMKKNQWRLETWALCFFI
jgi:hypothetical protein